MKLNFLQMKRQKHFYLTVLMKLSKNWNSEWLILKCSYKVQKNKEPYRLLAYLFVAFSSNCKHFASTKPRNLWFIRLLGFIILFKLANKILSLYFLVLALWFYLVLYVFNCPKSIGCTEWCYQIVITSLLSINSFIIFHIPSMLI